MGKHKMVDGRLLQMNKSYGQLKQKQKEKLSEWMYQAYRKQSAENLSDEETLQFVDLDSEFLFEKGFVDGIKRCAGPEGMLLGYGYEYTEEIFTDMGMKAPIRLLGSKEANRLRFEAITEEMRKKGL